MDAITSKLRQIKKENPKLFAQMILQLSPEEQQSIIWDWNIFGRDKQLAPEGKWRFWVLSGGRSSGKDLANSTPILTANRGWITMGDIAIGDIVFDENGQQTTVIDKYIPPVRDLYKFIFSDGSEIISSEEHEWVTLERKDIVRYNKKGITSPRLLDWGNTEKNGFSVKTTKTIINSLKKRNGINELNNHYIPSALAIEFEEKQLPIHPYVFGYCLGDACTATGSTVSCASEDKAWLMDIFEQFGHTVTNREDKNHFGITGIRKTWVDLKLNEGKYIPDDYIFSSKNQRIQLLQGLIDSDGYVDHRGYFLFTNTNKALVDGFSQICSSLGLTPKIKTRIPKDGVRKQYWTCWVISDINLSLIERKAKKHIFKESYQNRGRYITRCEKVEWEPTSCIEVDSPNHLFLAGKTLIPTHNTRSASEWIIQRARAGLGPIALIGQTSGDVRDVMIELGPSSIIQSSPPNFKPHYEPSKRRLTWPNGVTATAFSGDEPSQLRGPQHQTVWIDELPKFDDPEETFDQMNFGLRIGESRCLISTTPTPHPIMKKLYNQWKENPEGKTRYVVMPTKDNAANIDPEFLSDIEDKYQGTRLYRQEVLGEILWESEDALFSPDDLDEHRVQEPPELESIAIAIDIATTSKKTSDSTGIVISGLGVDGHGYVLDDKTMKGTPSQWANKIVALYDYYSQIAPTHCIIETNQGGDLIKHTLTQVRQNLPIKEVRAVKNKVARMEPVSLLAEQGRVHLVGTHPELEDQLVGYNGKGPSPDRYDAMCYSITSLMINPKRNIVTSTEFYL